MMVLLSLMSGTTIKAQFNTVGCLYNHPANKTKNPQETNASPLVDNLMLKDSLKKSNVIQFVGPRGSGRMYTVKSLCGEYHVLAVESTPIDDSLQIICNALFFAAQR